MLRGTCFNGRGLSLLLAFKFGHRESPADRPASILRGRMRRTVLIAIAGCLATAAIVALGGYFWERPTSLKVAVTRDTDDFRLMTAIQHVFGKERESIRFKLDPVNDAAASAAALESGEADLAVVRSDIAVPPSGQTLVILHRNAAVILVPARSE